MPCSCMAMSSSTLLTIDADRRDVLSFLSRLCAFGDPDVDIQEMKVATCLITGLPGDLADNEKVCIALARTFLWSQRLPKMLNNVVCMISHRIDNLIKL